MRHIFNVVSAGIFLGLSLFAICILTALYASAWQAATILASLVGVFVSVSIYFGERVDKQALLQKLGQAQTQARTLAHELEQTREQSRSLSDALVHTEANLDECARALLRDTLVIVHLVIVTGEEVDEVDEEPHLFI